MKTGISKPKLIGMYGLCIAIPVAILVCINTLHVTPKLEEAQKAIAAESAATAALIVTTPVRTAKRHGILPPPKDLHKRLIRLRLLPLRGSAPAEATELSEGVKGKAAALQTELNKSKDDKGASDVVNKYTDKKLSAKDVSIWGNMVFQLLFVMMGPIVFTLLIKNYREMLIQLLRLPRYWVGVIAQFFYVGVQIAAWTWLNKYCCAQLGIESDVAATYYIISLILFIVCRWVATYYMKKFNPADMMALFAVVAVGCCFGTMYLPTEVLFTIGGLPFSLNIICLILMSGGMSLMFPTIYGIALGGLNSRIVKLGAAGLIMAILGGAVITPWMGSIVESASSCWLALTREQIPLGTTF